MQYSPSCQTDSAGKFESAHLKINSVTRAVAVLACAVGLTACSSKPETADIQKDLAEAYACPVIELSDVKKADGAAADGKLYVDMTGDGVTDFYIALTGVTTLDAAAFDIN